MLNKKLIESTHPSYGKRHGNCRLYYSNGQILEGQFKNDIKYDKTKIYDSDGNFLFEEHWLKGICLKTVDSNNIETYN